MSVAASKIIVSHAITGFILWYGVEKLFLQQLGFSTFGISLMAVAYIGISAIFNVPTGILSDRYGRKPVLIGASILLLLSTVLAAMAQTPAGYVLAAVLWGLFYTTQNGAYESILYDTLKAEGRKAEYARYSGLSMSAFWLMVFVSSVLGGWVGSEWGLRAAFWVTVVPNIVNIIIVCSLHEPARKLVEKTESSLSMAKQGLRVLLRTKTVMFTAAVYLFIGVFGWTLNEFDQLFFIDLGLGVFLIGLFNGLSALAQAAGGIVGHRLHRVSMQQGLILLLVIYVATFALPVQYRWLAIALFLVLVFFRSVFYVRNDAELHHQLPSSIRNTAVSSLGIVNDIVVVFGYLLFGAVSQYSNARQGYLAVGVYGVALLAVAGIWTRFRTFDPEQVLAASDDDDESLEAIDAFPR